MRPFFLSIAMLILALLASERPRAADAEGIFAVKGVGQISCEDFREAHSEQGDALILAAGWINGYITALNRSAEGTFDLLPWQRIELLLDLVAAHCEQRPEQQLNRAVQLMVQTFEPTRLTAKSEIVTVPGPEGSEVDIYRDILMRAQQELKERGHYTSTIDGQFGPGTEAAFKSFQSEAELPQTGVPDQLTLLRLFESDLR